MEGDDRGGAGGGTLTADGDGMFLEHYLQLKLWIIAAIPIPRDGFHLIAGFLFYWISVRLFRRSSRSLQALFLGFLISLFVEHLDMLDNYGSLMRWLPYPRTWHRPLRDLVTTNIPPLLTLLAIRWRGGDKVPAESRAEKPV